MAVCIVQCAVCNAQFTVRNEQYAVCNIQCGVCNVQCAVCICQCVSWRRVECAPSGPQFTDDKSKEWPAAARGRLFICSGGNENIQ